MRLEMKRHLAHALGASLVGRAFGPNWPTLAEDIAATVFDALGIKELVVSHTVPDYQDIRADGEELMRMAKAQAARAVAHKIAADTPVQFTTLHGPASEAYPMVRLEASVLVITRAL
jgi:hypothetical protein